MTKTGPRVEFAALVRTLVELEERFLRAHLGPPTLAPPSRAEVLDVAAYVVLAHGALENFVEGLALWVLGRAVSNWTKKRRTTRCTASLLLYQDVPDASQSTVFDNIRTALDRAKSALSKSIEGNHGVTPRHLQELFSPLGVTVPNDPVLTGSLELIVSIRHQWAHRYRYSPQLTRSAADVKVAVGDCLAFAQKLANDVTALRP
jgi:hypothetical protein